MRRKNQVFQCKACFVGIPYYGIADKSKSGVCPKSSFEFVSTLYPCSNVPWLHMGWGLEWCCAHDRSGASSSCREERVKFDAVCRQGFFPCWPPRQLAFKLRSLVSCLKNSFSLKQRMTKWHIWNSQSIKRNKNPLNWMLLISLNVFLNKWMIVENT